MRAIAAGETRQEVDVAFIEEMEAGWWCSVTAGRGRSSIRTCCYIALISAFCYFVALGYSLRDLLALPVFLRPAHEIW